MTETSNVSSRPHERDYLERTIATVRNHREADNCWPQWANIFADEIERLWAERDERLPEEARCGSCGLITAGRLLGCPRERCPMVTP